MTSKQRRDAIINTQERIDTLLALYARGDDSSARAYRANLAETIVNGVLALTADKTQDELDRVADAMHHAQERWSRLKKAETHQ